MGTAWAATGSAGTTRAPPGAGSAWAAAGSAGRTRAPLGLGSAWAAAGSAGWTWAPPGAGSAWAAAGRRQTDVQISKSVLWKTISEVGFHKKKTLQNPDPDVRLSD